jgi:hypothetical protein
VAEAVHLRAMTVVRLVRALALGHGRGSSFACWEPA